MLPLIDTTKQTVTRWGKGRQWGRCPVYSDKCVRLVYTRNQAVTGWWVGVGCGLPWLIILIAAAVVSRRKQQVERGCRGGENLFWVGVSRPRHALSTPLPPSDPLPPQQVRPSHASYFVQRPAVPMPLDGATMVDSIEEEEEREEVRKA